MPTQETQQRFIERRAQGWSLVRIAAELEVAQSTLDWSRKFCFKTNPQGLEGIPSQAASSLDFH